MTPTDPNRPDPPIRGAGGPIIVSLMGGAAIGFLFHQPTIGFLIGALVGSAIALILWLRDRRG